MEIERICVKCGKPNTLTSETLKEMEVWTEEDKQYKLTYYQCTECHEKVIVQVDNKKTMEELKQLKLLIVDTAKKKMEGKTISPKRVKKKDKLFKSLTKERPILMQELNGKKILDSNKNIILERLTFQKESDIIDSNM